MIVVFLLFRRGIALVRFEMHRDEDVDLIHDDVEEDEMNHFPLTPQHAEEGESRQARDHMSGAVRDAVRRLLSMQ